MLALFARLAADLSAGIDFRTKPEYGTLIRGLDHWGISKGELFEAAVKISNSIRDLDGSA
jgi:hypothetical protein